MSLLHQALLDLEERAPNSGEVLAQQCLPRDRFFYLWQWPFYIVFALALILSVGVYEYLTHHPTVIDLPVSSANDSPPASQGREKNITDETRKNLPVSAFITTRSPDHNNNEFERRIADLLGKADEAITRDRLSLPRHQSAFFFLKQVLSLSPNDHRAVARMHAIKARYAELVTNMMTNNPDKASSFLRNLKKNLRPDVWRDFEKNHPQFSGVIAMRPLTDRYASQEYTLTNTKKKIDRLIAQERYREALSIMRSVPLTVNAPIRRMLTERSMFILLTLQNWKGLKVILEQETDLGRHHIYYHAQMLLATRGDQEAIRYLNEHKPLDEQSAHTLAGIYQRRSLHDLALAEFKSLIDTDGVSSQYWLGVAVNADALKQYELAQKGYVRAAALGGHAKNIDDFIRQRINAIDVFLSAQRATLKVAGGHRKQNDALW